MTCAYVHRLRTELRRSAWMPFQRRQRGHSTTEQSQPRSLTTPLSPWFNADSALSTLTGAREQAVECPCMSDLQNSAAGLCALHLFFACFLLVVCWLVWLVACSRGVWFCCIIFYAFSKFSSYPSVCDLWGYEVLTDIMNGTQCCMANCTDQTIYIWCTLVTQMANTCPWLSNSCIFVFKWSGSVYMIIG